MGFIIQPTPRSHLPRVASGQRPLGTKACSHPDLLRDYSPMAISVPTLEESGDRYALCLCPSLPLPHLREKAR